MTAKHRVWWQDGVTEESLLDMPKDAARIEKLNLIAHAVEDAFGGFTVFSVRYGIANTVLKALEQKEQA